VAERYNFARFLGHLRDRRGALGPVELGQGDLIVIDEASMISNPDLADIVDYAARTGVKVAMALDHQQLQAVENGGGASLITRTQGDVQLPEPVRFREQWERTASLGLREGKGSALGDYAEHGRIRAGTAEEILEATAQAYVAHTLGSQDCVVIARSHEVRRELCRRVRDDLQHLGLVARDGPTIEIADGQQAGVGDLLVCTKTTLRWMRAARCWRTSMCCASRRSPPGGRWSAGCSTPTRRRRRHAGPNRRSCSPATIAPIWDMR